MMTQNDDILLKPQLLFAFFKVIPLILLALTFLFLAWYLSPYFVLFAIGICGCAWYQLLYIRSYRYLVTAEYIRLTSGIFFKRTDQVEMFRVKDYTITQSFILQIFKLMHLTLITTDSNNKVVRLQGITESAIIDTIRERVQLARHNNNIYELN